MRVALLLAAIAASAAAAPPNFPVTLFGAGTSEVMYEYQLSPERADRLPRWSPNDGPPPLAIRDATAVAEKWIKQQNPEVKLFALTSITLAHVTWPESLADRWFYRIEFNPIVGGQMLFGGRFTVVVLFDGTVVEPQVEKRTRAR
jgi:hypothetical protein